MFFNKDKNKKYTWVLFEKRGNVVIEDILKLSYEEARLMNESLPENKWLLPNGKEQFR